MGLTYSPKGATFQFKVGDTVKVTWTFEEHYRIDKIERVEAVESAPKAELPRKTE